MLPLLFLLHDSCTCTWYKALRCVFHCRIERETVAVVRYAVRCTNHKSHMYRNYWHKANSFKLGCRCTAAAVNCVGFVAARVSAVFRGKKHALVNRFVYVLSHESADSTHTYRSSHNTTLRGTARGCPEEEGSQRGYGCTVNSRSTQSGGPWKIQQEQSSRASKHRKIRKSKAEP